MSLFPIKTQTLTYFIIILNIFPSVSKQAGVEPKSISTENKAAERDSNNQTHSSAVFCGKIHFVLFYRKELRLPLFNWNLAGHAMPPGTAAGRRNTREATAKIDKRVVAERGRGGEGSGGVRESHYYSADSLNTRTEQRASHLTANSLFHWTTFTAFQQANLPRDLRLQMPDDASDWK